MLKPSEHKQRLGGFANTFLSSMRLWADGFVKETEVLQFASRLSRDDKALLVALKGARLSGEIRTISPIATDLGQTLLDIDPSSPLNTSFSIRLLALLRPLLQQDADNYPIGVNDIAI